MTIAWRSRRPLPGSLEALRAISRSIRFVVVTSRQSVLQEVTKQWIEAHFPGVFEGVHFGNHYSADGSPSRSKAEICKDLGAVALIDDSRHHALACAKAGVPLVILFGDYSWNKPSMGVARESKGATPKPGAEGAAAAEASSAADEERDSTLAAGMQSVHLCPEWKAVKAVLERLTASGELAPVPSLWVRGGPPEAAPYALRARAVLQRQEELNCTAVGVSITPLLAVVESLTREGFATIVNTSSGLDAAFGGKAERMPRLTVKVRRTPALLEHAAAKERQIALQTDATNAVAAETAKKDFAAAAAAGSAATE